VKVRLERRYRFSASHLYRRPEWSEEENRARFGRCTNPHGHNYRLYVQVAGEPDPATGFIVDLTDLDRLLTTHVLDRLDHRHLNALPQFADGTLIPSSENLVTWIHRALIPHLPPSVELVSLRVEEDEDLAALWESGD
jgi:6-pyruvoyltetrahydropterin/6-carboxytetrahydropterin synthase